MPFQTKERARLQLKPLRDGYRVLQILDKIHQLDNETAQLKLFTKFVPCQGSR